MDPVRMLRRLSGGLLILWMAFLVSDRVDFLGGAAGFKLNPFLVLTPLLLGVEALRLLGSGERLKLGRGAAAYLLLLLALMAVVVLSTLFAAEQVMSARRNVLLMIVAGGTLLVAAMVAGEGGREAELVQGAKLGLVVALIFSLGQALTILGSVPTTLRLGPTTIELWIHAQFGLIPRFSGQVADANRGGLLLLVYLFTILRWDRSRKRRLRWGSLAAVMLLLTLSRSAIMAALATGLLAWVESRRFRLSRRAVLATAMTVALVSGWLLMDRGFRASFVRTAEPLAERFSPREASLREHFHLLGRGVEEATRSVARASIGFGYGNAYLFLEDVFPNTKYGNYHSLYVSMLAEAGVMAFLLSLALLAYPLLVPGPYRALVAGLVLFNVFYQATAEPSFWFPLALAWLTALAGREKTLQHAAK